MDVEFEPRRRQDADAIVMVAEPTVARQFKPLFAFISVVTCPFIRHPSSTRAHPHPPGTVT